MRPGAVLTRRRLLGVLVAGSTLAPGCNTEAEGPPDGTVHCYNQTNFERSVRVRVDRPGGASLLDETFSVPPGERVTSAAVMPEAGEYEVVATSDGDRSARTLTFPADADGIKGYVRVSISRDGVLVARAGLR